MPPLFPVARCFDCRHFSAPHRILVRRTLKAGAGKAGTGRTEYIEQREGIYRLSKAIGLEIHLFSSHPVRLVGSGDGLAELLVPAAGITELLARS
jgi:hypothetical protein